VRSHQALHARVTAISRPSPIPWFFAACVPARRNFQVKASGSALASDVHECSSKAAQPPIDGGDRGRPTVAQVHHPWAWNHSLHEVSSCPNGTRKWNAFRAFLSGCRCSGKARNSRQSNRIPPSSPGSPSVMGGYDAQRVFDHPPPPSDGPTPGVGRRNPRGLSDIAGACAGKPNGQRATIQEAPNHRF